MMYRSKCWVWILQWRRAVWPLLPKKKVQWNISTIYIRHGAQSWGILKHCICSQGSITGEDSHKLLKWIKQGEKKEVQWNKDNMIDSMRKMAGWKQSIMSNA